MDSGERVSSSRNLSMYSLRTVAAGIYACTQEAARRSLATLDETRRAEDQPRVAEGQRLQTGQA